MAWIGISSSGLASALRWTICPSTSAHCASIQQAKSFAGGVQRLQELTSIMRRHGKRRYPPAFFNYCWHPYQDAFLEKLRQAVPWLRWTWLERGSESLRKLVTYFDLQASDAHGTAQPVC